MNQTQDLVPSKSEQLLPSLPLLPWHTWIVLGVTLPSTRLLVTGVREGLCCQSGTSKAFRMEGEKTTPPEGAGAEVGAAATVLQNTHCCYASLCCAFLENRASTFKAGFTQYAERQAISVCFRLASPVVWTICYHQQACFMKSHTGCIQGS